MKQNKLRGLYAITDESLIPSSVFAAAVSQALAGGASMIQYRDKSMDDARRLDQATTLQKLCNDHGALLIINDDIALAKSIKANGVHLGQDDKTIKEARTVLGNNAIIGFSCYNRLDLALEAEQAGADYVAFGTMFPSPTKPDAPVAGTGLIAEAKTRLGIPVCAIGGITWSNVEDVIEAGADITAIISGLFSERDIRLTAKHITRLFD